MRTALYPGSFDPVTTGHLDIIARAAAQFDRLIVGILHNPQKVTGAFPVEERVALIETVIAPLANVEVRAMHGLLVDAAKGCGADVVVRGIRTTADIEIELQMARINRQMSGIDTLMLAAAPQVVHISANMVREIGRLGGSLKGLVPDAILARVSETLQR